LGERLGCVIIQLHQCVRLDFRLSEHGFRFFFFTRTSTGPTLYFFSFVFALAALVLWPQYLAIIFTLFRTKELLKFYEKLAGKRDSAKGGIVDSYKHLREHGNSFFIVTLEVVLAIILFTAGNFDAAVGAAASATKEPYVLPYIWIVLIWILPAALLTRQLNS
jgi:hypothetical protein